MPRAIFIWLKSHMYKKYLRVKPLAQREVKRMPNDVQKGVRLNFDDVYKFLKNLKKNPSLRFVWCWTSYWDFSIFKN